MMKFEIIDPSRIIGADLAHTMLRAIHRNTPQLRDTELGRVIDRTPYLTGGLQADETGTYNLDYDTDELIHLYTETSNQIENWNRVYAAYVEGPPIGVNGLWRTSHFEETGTGWQMFAAAETEDIPTFETWGYSVIEDGVADIVGGRSLRL